MGCDGGLLSAGGSVEPLMWVVQELCNLYHGGACLDVICRVKSGQVGSSRYKSGQSGRYFFLAIVVVTLLHRFFRFRRRFLVLAASPRHASTTFADAGLRSVRWRLGGRVSCPDASGRFKPGRKGQFSYIWTFAFGFAHVPSLSLLGYG